MNSPIRTLPQAGANGLRPSDIVRYSSLTITAKRKARDRAVKLVQNLIVGHTETSILPPHLISEIWHSANHYGRKLSKLVVWEAYDGGTNFRLEEISRISPETPCRLIHDE